MSERNNKASNFIKKLILCIITVLILIAAVVFALDPFYHYHKPWFGLKAVLHDKEYQCVGTLRNFDYDTLLVGSSVMENNNNAWYDEAFGGTSIKAIRSYGATADLCYLTTLKEYFITLIHLHFLLQQRQPMNLPVVRCICTTKILLMMCSIFSTRTYFLPRYHISWRTLLLVTMMRGFPITGLSGRALTKKWPLVFTPEKKTLRQ